MPRPVITSPHKKIRTVCCFDSWVEDNFAAGTLMGSTLRSAWPKVVQRLWRGGFVVLELCRSHVSGK